jgi:hypothetical protein
MRVRTPQEVIREMGRDPETVLDEWQKWDEMLKARNIAPAETLPAIENTNKGNDDAEDDDD